METVNIFTIFDVERHRVRELFTVVRGRESASAQRNAMYAI